MRVQWRDGGGDQQCCSTSQPSVPSTTHSLPVGVGPGYPTLASESSPQGLTQ